MENVYPLSLVLLLSFTVEVTVNDWVVEWRVVSLVFIVTALPETEIQASVDKSGEKVSVSVWLHPAYYVQAGIVQL